MASKHDSILGNLLWKTDPLALAFGEDSKYTETIHGSIPTELNRIGSDIVSPFAEVDKAINPMRQIGIVDDISTWTENKPADALGMFFGAAYGAPALGSLAAPAGGSTASTGGMGGLGFNSIGGLGSSSAPAAPASQGFMSSVGGDILTNVGSSVLTGLFSGGGDSTQQLSGGSAGRGAMSSLSALLSPTMTTAARAPRQRGGFL